VDSVPNATVTWPPRTRGRGRTDVTDIVQGVMWPHNFWTCLPRRRQLVLVISPLTCQTTSSSVVFALLRTSISSTNSASWSSTPSLRRRSCEECGFAWFSTAGERRRDEPCNLQQTTSPKRRRADSPYRPNGEFIIRLHYVMW